MLRRIENGDAGGLLAYVDNRPVGWCHAAPKADMPRAAASPLGRGADVAEVGSIVCFFVLPAFLRKGVARRLLDTACDSPRRQGFRYAEAYALADPGNDAQEYRGWLPMYLDAGFTVVTGIGDRFGGPRIDSQRAQAMRCGHAA